MNPHLQNILNLIQQDQSLTAEQKNAIVQSLKDADKEIQITAFKLDRTEKVKRTTAILLEETIAELEQKRKDVEAQNRELEIEAALERVRARAMTMQASSELNSLIGLVYTELTKLDIILDRCFIMIFDEANGATWWMGSRESDHVHKGFYLKPHDHAPHLAYIQAWKTRQEKWKYVLEGEAKKAWDDFIFSETELAQLPDFVISNMKSVTRAYISGSFNNFGCITTGGLEPLSESAFDILVRFAKVFDLTYTRFNDLQKAEEQAREAKIETALEKVRSRTMAMQRSDELGAVAEILFKQVKELGIHPWTTGFNIWQEGNDAYIDWITNPSGGFVEPYRVDLTTHPIFRDISNAKKRGEEFQAFDLSGEPLAETYALLMSFAPKQFEGFLSSGFSFPTRQINHYVYGAQVGLMFITPEPVPEAHDIFKRFGKVFEQTYTRFLDLQKAEAQAKEAQIETALERIRAKALAMQKSTDLLGVANVLREQMRILGQPELESSIVHLYKDNFETIESWYAYRTPDHPSGDNINGTSRVSRDCSAWSREVIEKYKSPETEYLIVSHGKKLAEWYAVLEKIAPAVLEYDNDQLVIPDVLYYYFVKFSGGSLLMVSNSEPSLEARELQKRAALVFDLAYTRFLDLQKAEEQAKEAQIQLALERVRARTMAMHQSTELAETVHVLFEQFRDLGENPERMAIGIVNEEEKVIEIWATQHGGTLMNSMYKFTIDEPHVMNKLYTAWKKQESVTLDLKGNELDEYFQFLKNAGALVDRNAFGERRVQMAAFFSRGLLMTISPDPRPDGTMNLLERFAAVFNLTYTRFLDLQKAEAQTREAIIEASLEKVRGKAMGMHDSKDLSSTAIMVFTELNKLGIKPIRNGVGILSKDSRKGQLYSATSSNEVESLALVGWVELSGHRILTKVYDSWFANEDYFPVLEGEELKAYYEQLLTGLTLPSVPNGQSEEKQYGHFIAFSIGCLYSWASKPYTEDEIKILKRFAAIIDLTFRRYLELQNSEANAREAIKQSSLDRVRAEIASMRSVDDLNHITPIVWRELTTLGVPFFRCGIFIIKEDEQLVHIYLSTPEGKSLAVLHLPFTGADITVQTVDHWRKQQIYSTHWDRDQFISWVKTLQGQGQVKSAESYQGAQAPPESLTLQFIPFAQGMLYIGSADTLNEDQLSLAKELANAFSVAYARYEDFKKLEEAKSKIETTLSDLKATQSQLVQSEKMASLGELTAGIAHEIQNPLNFVNNFAEINNELILELEEAAGNQQRDASYEQEIIATIKENSEKINHHGKRAESIVRGMLQHSRKSAGIKEPTDINALADEYMRLSYHGLRAKDKSFNAEFKIDLDPTLPLINVIPQDIGRVFLNLFNNAFWAVNERQHNFFKNRDGVKNQNGDGQALGSPAFASNSGDRGKTENLDNINSVHPPAPKGELNLVYQPIVILTTKNLGDHIEIRIADNGTGIPPNIIDKIFQPFFTTKPTGQGTGLGLSLAYDIIKAHGGEIKVETKDGEARPDDPVGRGSEFIIQLTAA